MSATRKEAYLCFLISACCAAFIASSSFAQDTLPLPEFTLQGIALHPDDLNYAPTGDLVHPSIIKTEGRIPDPLAKYYMYYSPHKHLGISLAYSNSMDGPWIEYENNPVIVEAAVPDIRWIGEKEKFYMWGHRKNVKTELWTSTDGIHFDYNGVSITAGNIGTKNATYTRVYEFPVARFGNKYIMLYSGLIEETGIRSVWLAHSTDAENWVQLDHPLVEPVEGEFDNIYGPALLQYDARNFIVYQDMTSWRGGNIKYVEVDSALHSVGKGGTRYVLLDPSPGLPLNDRYRGAEFYLVDDMFYMYSSASRDPRLIVYATANAVPPRDTSVTVGMNSLTRLKVSIYPNPFADVLIIAIPDLHSTVTARLYDLNGLLHRSIEIDQAEFHLQVGELAGGMYIMEIVDEGNALIHRQKLIRAE